MKSWFWILALVGSWAFDVAAQDAVTQRGAPDQVRRTATIHWQQVPLGDAVARLEGVFEATVFVDRRVDRSQRVSFDAQAASVEEVLAAVADSRQLGVSRLGRLTYLGPRRAAEQMTAVVAMRMQEVARLPASQRASLVRSRRVTWPRLTEPRGLVTSLVEQHGWRVEQAERIPHDLWPAGTLPELPLAEQLTVLLAGFDLTFEIRPRERVLAIVPLEEIAAKTQAVVEPRTTPSRAVRPAQETRQVYTLRVAEQPVGAVLHELAGRLNWHIELDEAAIRAADLSLERRVSFAVENVEQDELLEALLRPAGLTFRRDGERITIIPRDDGR